MSTESAQHLQPSHIKGENSQKELKRELEGEEISHHAAKRMHKGHELAEESEGEHTVDEEDMAAMKPHEEHEIVKKRIKKSRIAVSKQYVIPENKELGDMLYALSREYFKAGDRNRYVHYDSLRLSLFFTYYVCIINISVSGV